MKNTGAGNVNTNSMRSSDHRYSAQENLGKQESQFGQSKAQPSGGVGEMSGTKDYVLGKAIDLHHFSFAGKGKGKQNMDSMIQATDSISPYKDGTEKAGESSSKSPENARKLFFKPLNKHTTREQVFECLKKFGRIDYLRVPFSNKKRKNLGYGFVVFHSQSVADHLCDLQIKTMIDDKIVGFTKFDTLKYKGKGFIYEPKSEEEDEGLIDDENYSSVLKLSTTEAKTSESLTFHFLKPTARLFFSIERNVEFSKKKYKYNLEKLRGKELRDERKRISTS